MEHSELAVCQLEDGHRCRGGQAAGWAVEYVCKSSRVFLLGIERCILQSRDRKEGAEIQELGLHWLGSHHWSPLSIGKLTLDPAGLAVAPYLP